MVYKYFFGLIIENIYVQFLEAHGVVQTPGDIVTSTGTVIGRHFGLHRHTVGQRKGLGVAWKNPLHVLAIDTDKNQIIAGEREELGTSSLTAGSATWNSLPEAAECRTHCSLACGG